MAKPKTVTKTKRPRPPFAMTEEVKAYLTLTRADKYETQETDGEDLPLLKKLYLNKAHDLIAETPCGERCVVATDRKELNAIRDFLNAVNSAWETMSA